MVLNFQEQKIPSLTSKIIFKDLHVEYICKRSLKNSYISIKLDLENEEFNYKIILKTPKTSKSYINNLLEEKESWIRGQILHVQKNIPRKVNLEDEVLLFGDIYSIDIKEAQRLRELLSKQKTNSKDSVLKCYHTFYKEYAKEYLTPRIEYFASIMNLKYSHVRFSKMKSRWGSCGANKRITLNTKLIKIDKDLIDYVIVHELAHLVHMNHSKAFHTLVDKHLPNSKQLLQNLKKQYI